MKWIISFAGIILLLCMEPVCRGQQLITISDPRLELRDNIVYISYDILNSNRGVEYSVRLEVTDSTGQRIDASALAGDIGEGIIGGRRKQITWDLSADSVFIDSDIYITVYANEIKIIQAEETKEPEEEITVTGQVSDEQEQVNVQEEEIPEAGPVSGDTEENATKGANPVSETEASLEAKDFNRTLILLQSLAVPGLGLSRVKGKPHWIKGVAAFGCVAGSVLYWNKANSSLADYNSADRDDWRTYYQDVADWQRQISITFAASAAAIWISDLIWTTVGTSGRGRSKGSSGAGWRILTGIEPCSAVPTLGFRYRF